MENKRYGLFTAIALIIGTVIGSGIFFKSDNILIYTKGNVWLGVLVFCFAAIAIVFGCLSISELAKRSDKTGGVISFAGDFCNRKTASSFGWFFGLIYYPTLGVVVSWVVGIYSCILFNLNGSLTNQMTIGAAFLLFCIFYNIFSAKFAGLFQRGATVIKLIPLFIIAIVGLIIGDPQSLNSPQAVEGAKTLGWLAAIGPIAFAFDGWIVATCITSELKNAKRNLPLALIISPLFILVIYIAYFIGINKLIGTDQILSLKDAHVNLAATKIFGNFGAKLILVCVLVSVMGTVNGLVMAGIRTPYALALDNMAPLSKKLKKMNSKLNMPVNSGILFAVLSGIWYVVHYLTMNFNVLPNSDISEISIVVQYLLYVILYIQVIKLKRSGEIKSKFFGLVAPIFAILGSIIILVGGLQNPLAPLYALFCFVILAIGYLYGKKNVKS